MEFFLWCLGLLVGSLVEWIAHRYVLHNFTLRFLSYSHFSVHHRNSRKNKCKDADYLKFPPTKLSSGLSEIIMLLLLAVLLIPVYDISIGLWLGMQTHIFLYYYLHRRFHLHPKWGRKWMRCHWDHHMGKDQNSNWGVTNPIFDYVFGTRKKYLEDVNSN